MQNPKPSSSWSFTKKKCFIAAHKEYYDRLKSTKSSQGRKNIWEDTLKLFQSMCFDNGVDSEKSLVQLKEKCRALLDKYKSVCDNNNRTGREQKTFKHYEDIDEFMASSDKVNPRFVKETKANKQNCSCDDTISCQLEIKILARKQRNGQPPLLKAIVRLQRKLEKLGNRRKKDQRRKGSAAMTWS